MPTEGIEDVDTELNLWGDKGWELAAIREENTRHDVLGDSAVKWIQCVLKRPKEEWL